MKSFCLFFIWLCYINNIIACECFQLRPFLNEVRSRTKIAKIRIVDHGVLSDLAQPSVNSDVLSHIPPIPKKYHSFTKVVITDMLLGDSHHDTLLFLNKYANNCYANLSNENLGSEFIIRYNDIQIDRSDIELLHLGNMSHLEPVAASDCVNWRLTVRESIVEGNIFTSKRAEEAYKLMNIAEALDKSELENLHANLKNIGIEVISFEALKAKCLEIKLVLKSSTSN